MVSVFFGVFATNLSYSGPNGLLVRARPISTMAHRSRSLFFSWTFFFFRLLVVEKRANGDREPLSIKPCFSTLWCDVRPPNCENRKRGCVSSFFMATLEKYTSIGVRMRTNSIASFQQRGIYLSVVLFSFCLLSTSEGGLVCDGLRSSVLFGYEGIVWSVVFLVRKPDLPPLFRTKRRRRHDDRQHDKLG